MTEPSNDLLVEREDGIVIVTLNRPRMRNTVSFAMWEAFADLLTELEGDSPARALVIRGADGYFSSGGDVKTPPARGEGALSRGKRLEMGQRVIGRIAALPIPTIAAVEGGAWGVAWGLALACDVLIAGAAAQFGAPFLKMGLTPDGGVAWQLTRQLGRRRAAEIVFSGRALGAAEALELGLASRVVPDGTAVDAALAFARGIGEGNVQAAELAKRMLHEAEASTLAQGFALELAFCQITQASDEAARARAAFIAAAEARKAAKG
ncbi:MAG: enoyl-CoA hydratase/isomerase family protein [Sphingomonadales bacterium]|nr:enoyl-CoA hydratase/isomerase family protein [Sphingomonadales bacterium]